MRRSSLFIVGAMKAGTTTLFDYLASYPELAACKIKEPHYYAEDLRDEFAYTRVSEAEAVSALRANPETRLHQAAIETPRVYNSLFEPSDATLTLEASPSYLASAVASDRIAKEAPDPHVVILLRNPYERIVSHFEMIQSKGVDRPLKDLLASELKQGVPPVNNKQAALLRLSLYSSDVQRWITTMGRDRVHVYTTEQLAQNIGHICNSILSSFGIKSDAGTSSLDHVRKNVTNPVRFPRLNGLLTKHGIRHGFARHLPSGVLRALKRLYFRDRRLDQYYDALEVVRQVIDEDLVRLNDILQSRVSATIETWRQTSYS